MTRDEIFQSVTDRITEQLRNGIVPWRKPWGRDAGQEIDTLLLPINAKTGKAYQGVNVPLLWLANFDAPHWATEKTWNELGAGIKEDSPVEIFFSSFANDKPFLKSYKVYNLEQVDGCEHLRSYALAFYGHSEYDCIDSLVFSAKVVVKESNSAWYDSGEDVVHCPARKFFRSDVGYYTTLLHEMAHWTGHHSRLDRKFGVDKNSVAYAVEELIAEITTCFVAAKLNVPERLSELPNQANYIGEWLRKLDEDNQAFFKVCSASQKAANFLMRFAPKVSGVS